MVENRRKDGSLYHESATISPVTDSRGHISGYVAIKRDATQQAILYKARAYFTSVTSHELRTPLTKLEMVRLLLERMSGGTASADEIMKAAQVFGESLDDLERIVNAVGILNGVVSLGDRPPEEVGMEGLLLDCVERARNAATKIDRKVVIDLTPPPAAPPSMATPGSCARPSTSCSPTPSSTRRTAGR